MTSGNTFNIFQSIIVVISKKVQYYQFQAIFNYYLVIIVFCQFLPNTNVLEYFLNNVSLVCFMQRCFQNQWFPLWMLEVSRRCRNEGMYFTAPLTICIPHKHIDNLCEINSLLWYLQVFFLTKLILTIYKVFIKSSLPGNFRNKIMILSFKTLKPNNIFE